LPALILRGGRSSAGGSTGLWPRRSWVQVPSLTPLQICRGRFPLNRKSAFLFSMRNTPEKRHPPHEQKTVLSLIAADLITLADDLAGCILRISVQHVRVSTHFLNRSMSQLPTGRKHYVCHGGGDQMNYEDLAKNRCVQNHDAESSTCNGIPWDCRLWWYHDKKGFKTSSIILRVALSEARLLSRP
jgi:hypothetical protein